MTFLSDVFVRSNSTVIMASNCANKSIKYRMLSRLAMPPHYSVLKSVPHRVPRLTLVVGYMADSIDSFLTQIGSQEEGIDALHLGFTFSFPVEQTALDSGTLLMWTKGFSAKNAQGNDVVKMLQDALDRKHVHVKCTALVNDVSTGTSSLRFGTELVVSVDCRNIALQSLCCRGLPRWMHLWHRDKCCLHR